MESVALGRTPSAAPAPRSGPYGARRWPPAAIRTGRFRRAVAPASPLAFGSVALAIVVLPEEVTSAGSLSAGFAGLMTALSFAPGVAVQPFARRQRDPLTGAVAGLACGAAATAAGLGAAAGQAGAFVALTAIVGAIALWTAGYAAHRRKAARAAAADTCVSGPAQDRDPLPR